MTNEKSCQHCGETFELDLILCPSCDRPLDESVLGGSISGEEGLEKICQQCQEINDANNSSCLFCGNSLESPSTGADDQNLPEPTTSQDRSLDRKCPHCGSTNFYFRETKELEWRCRKCGRAWSEIESDVQDLLKCPECGSRSGYERSTHENNRRCRRCGHTWKTTGDSGGCLASLGAWGIIIAILIVLGLVGMLLGAITG